MTNDQIKEIALANGFKLKEQPNGETDLNPYVYTFARALIAKLVMTSFENADSDDEFINNIFQFYRDAEAGNLIENLQNALDAQNKP